MEGKGVETSESETINNNNNNGWSIIVSRTAVRYVCMHIKEALRIGMVVSSWLSDAPHPSPTGRRKRLKRNSKVHMSKKTKAKSPRIDPRTDGLAE